MSNLGTHSNPHRVMQERDGDTFLPYAEWCLCRQCGQVGRSTFVFDFYGQPGEELMCESCTLYRKEVKGDE